MSQPGRQIVGHGAPGDAVAKDIAWKLREDFSAEQLRALARRSKDVNQSRRLLSLAAVRDGQDRREAARIGGMDRVRVNLPTSAMRTPISSARSVRPKARARRWRSPLPIRI